MAEIQNTIMEEFFIKNFNVDRIFNSIARADYLILYYISQCREEGENSSRVYLSSLAEKMNLPIPQISKAVKQLQEKGYVEWKMNEEKDRTYVELTETAVELMNDEQKQLENYWSLIHQEIPESDLCQMVDTMRKIGEILQR